MAAFDDLDAAGKELLKREFDNQDTSEERRVEIISMVKDGAQKAQMGRQCPMCKNYPFFIPYHKALIEGHVYSQDGYREIWISGYCEYCLDRITAETDEEEEN